MHFCTTTRQVSSRLLLNSICFGTTGLWSKCAFASSARSPGLYEIDKDSKEESRTSRLFFEHADGSKRWSPSSILHLAFPLTALALGMWQLRRLEWKKNLLKTLNINLNKAPVPFPDDNLAALKDLEYCKVRVTGEFLHDREFLVQPRARLDAEKDKPRVVAGEQSSTGAHVITPFQLDPSGLIVLVNRGWVSQYKMDPTYRKIGQLEGKVTFNAVVRQSENKSFFLRSNDPQKGLWISKDVEEMAKFYETEPIFLDATFESSIRGGPIGGQTRVHYSNDHMLYSITWFSVGFATLLAWLI